MRASSYLGGRRVGRDIPVLLGLLLLSLAVAAIGGAATASSVTSWYVGLDKPGFNPPNSLFGPVWTTLYILMAVAAWRVWRRRTDEDVRPALTLYGVQMVFNLAWSVIFFGLRQPGLAVIDILLLVATATATGLAFWRIDRPAGLMFVPYVAWAGFATALNIAIWRLN